jgi:hypothetical protein
VGDEQNPLTRGAAALVALAAAVLLLAGCSGSVARSSEPGIPDGLSIDQSEGLGAAAGWIVEGEIFAVVTWGSWSCPRAPVGLEAVGVDQLDLTFDAPSGAVCTADMAATTHTFDLPAVITERPITITVSYRDWDGTDTLTLD